MTRPVIIAHRGASGHRPEHTLAGYELAIAMGADFIEPDVVPTRDGALVVRHDNELSATTDVADRPELADRKTTKTVDGRQLIGWFVEDLTLDEVRTLRARERIPHVRPANTAFDGMFQIATLDEVLALATTAHVGVYPETKNPTYFAELGLALEEPLVAALHAAGFTGRDAPVYIQSFEVDNLRRLRTMTDLPLVQLLSSDGQPPDVVAAGGDLSYPDMATVAGLAEIATYADGIGPHKTVLVPTGDDGASGTPTTVVDDAHAVGLVVHAWTFRNEHAFLPADLHAAAGDVDGLAATATGLAPDEYRRFFDLGVDGVFSDHTDMAVAVRHAWLRDQHTTA
ncbi:MAG TPA: glycerophosphodiester phosphodiesterase [Euzebyales bacterium]|nr:glycerophosphodiester phosphodiesterase [Euzebyales bacterium]